MSSDGQATTMHKAMAKYYSDALDAWARAGRKEPRPTRSRETKALQVKQAIRRERRQLGRALNGADHGRLAKDLDIPIREYRELRP